MNTDKLRELLAKATSGPWFYESLTAGHAITSGETVVAFCGPKNPDESGYARNADLIAAMHESLPGLLSEIDRLTAELDRLRKDAERFRWLKENVQPWRNDNEKPHALVEICFGAFQGGVGWFRTIGPESHVGIITLDDAIDAAIAAHEGSQ